MKNHRVKLIISLDSENAWSEGMDPFDIVDTLHELLREPMFLAGTESINMDRMEEATIKDPNGNRIGEVNLKITREDT